MLSSYKWWSLIFSNSHDFAIPGKLARFSAPGIICLLLSGPLVQLHSRWLPLICDCHLLHLYACLARLVIVMIHGQLGRDVWLLPSLGSLHRIFWSPWKLDCKKETLISDLASVIFVRCPKSVVSSAIGSSFNPWKATMGYINNLYPLGYLNQYFERRFHVWGTGLLFGLLFCL